MTERELFREAVMQNMVDDARVKHASKKRKRHPVARKILVAAACLLVALCVTVYSIPTARAAVEDWLSGWFNAQEYLGKDSENRAGEPALDAVIERVGNDGRTVIITDIFNSSEAKEMANNFGIRLDEVAYSGDAIYITGWFTGISGKFLLDSRTGGDTTHEDSEYTEGNMMLSLPNGTVYYGALNAYFDDEMEQIIKDSIDKTQKEYDANETLVTTNSVADSLWYSWLETHEVRFIYTAVPESAVPAGEPLSGQIDAKLSFQQYYRDVANDSTVTLFRADLGTVAIDADAHKSFSSTKVDGQAVTLSGTHRMFIREWAAEDAASTVYSYVRDLNMSGVTISVDSVSFTPTGLNVTLRLDLPESWSRTERIAAIQGGESGGLNFIVLIDGKEIRHAFLSIGSKGNAASDNKDDPFLTSLREFSNSTLSRSQWDEAKTITFIPCTGWPTELILEDLQKNREELNRILLEPGVTVIEQIDITGTKIVDWQEDRMDDYALTIHLDDYR